MKSFQQFMKEFKDEQQDDQRDTDIQDVENKKDAYLKKKRKEEEAGKRSTGEGFSYLKGNLRESHEKVLTTVRSSRMVVKRKGAQEPSVIACTLLPDDPKFDFGPRLCDALGRVKLNHRHCATFCVLGGGSCTA